jgi:ABC-type transport system involved in multi-copper enzyme maturation permease subunit
MLRALVVKELRETAGIVILALIAYAGFVISHMGLEVLPISVSSSKAIPFVSPEFLSTFAIVAVCLAIALGFRQSAWEAVGDTYQFLLHRPISRWRIIGLKLLTGAGLYLVCSALPILTYAWWAATPGTHASPFEWSMTATSWQVWISMTILYLGSFLSGIRPARWIGTRLAPLAASGLLVAVIQFIPWWWVLGLAAVLLAGAVLTANILFVARTRDY